MSICSLTVAHHAAVDESEKKVGEVMYYLLLRPRSGTALDVDGGMM